MTGALLQADAALHEFSSPNEEWHWRFTVLKAEILVRQRRSKESLELLAPALPSSLAASETAVWRKMAQGAANCYLTHFDEAQKLLSQAQALAEAHHTNLLGEVALREGTLAFWRDDQAKAESEYRRTLQIAREQSDQYLEAAAMGSLGVLATMREHYDESVEWDAQALSMSESIGALSSVAKILVNMGWSYFEMGDYERSLSLFQQAEASAGKAGLRGDQAICRINIGAVDYFMHDYASAQKGSLDALELVRKLDAKPMITEGLNNLSLVALAQGEVDLAAKYNEDALATSRGAMDHPGELASTMIAGRVELARSHFPQAEELLEKVIHDPSAETSLRWEAQARLAETYAKEGQPAEADREFSLSIQTLEAARDSIQSEEFRLSFLTSAIEFYDDYVDFLLAQNRVLDALKVAELSRARTLEEGLASDSKAEFHPAGNIHPQKIARRLKSTLLFYWLGQKHSYLWVITPAKTTYFTLPPAPEVDRLVRSYREALLQSRDVLQSGNPDGKALYSALVEPAKELIPRNSRVILLPDGSLYSLNFETLIVPSPQPHYWIEDVTLSTSNSLTLLASAPFRPALKRKSLFLVGDTVPPSADFPVLPQAQAEIRQVEKYFPPPQRDILEGNQATPEAYLASHPGKFTYLHFVTHGTASRTRPLESAVILSKEKDDDVYKLYARDIVNQRLNAYLVTISACNGSGTRAYSGEGLVGLSWAFLRAGAHNVIGALWEVSDASTPELMDKLYNGLSHGQDPASALRAAKLFLLQSNSVYQKPFYWAPFQLYTGS